MNLHLFDKIIILSRDFLRIFYVQVLNGQFYVSNLQGYSMLNSAV